MGLNEIWFRMIFAHFLNLLTVRFCFRVVEKVLFDRESIYLLAKDPNILAAFLSENPSTGRLINVI